MDNMSSNVFRKLDHVLLNSVNRNMKIRQDIKFSLVFHKIYQERRRKSFVAEQREAGAGSYKFDIAS